MSKSDRKTPPIVLLSVEASALLQEILDSHEAKPLELDTLIMSLHEEIRRILDPDELKRREMRIPLDPDVWKDGKRDLEASINFNRREGRWFVNFEMASVG